MELTRKSSTKLATQWEKPTKLGLSWGSPGGPVFKTCLRLQDQVQSLVGNLRSHKPGLGIIVNPTALAFAGLCAKA